MTKIMKGDRARIAPKPIEGTVVDVRYDENEVRHLLLAWTEADGHEASRWFLADELQPAG